MAEEQQGQEKTEEATPRRIEKAREEGQVARSRELNSVAIVSFGALAALAMIPGIAKRITSITETAFTQAAAMNLYLPAAAGELAMAAVWAVLPFTLVMFVAGIVSSLAVGGFLFSPQALQPKLSRMSLIKGFGRMFSKKALVELGKSVAKFVLVAGVAAAVLYLTIDDLLVLGALPVRAAIAEGTTYVGWALLLIGSALIIVAAIDVPFQVSEHLRQLRMTKQEVKDELKDSEGKPEVKAKIRSLQQQVARRKMLEDLPNADVVITNPEHFSVAIQYDPATMAAPVLLAKGVDHMAMRIREVADHHDVPLVPVPVLARAVYYNAEAGDEIPAGLYVAVAQVLAYIYQLNQFQRGQIAHAPSLSNVEIPEDFYTGDGAGGNTSENEP